MNGDILVKGEKPFVYVEDVWCEQYDPGGHCEQDTGISSDTYTCAIAGFAAVDGDINESGTQHPIEVFTFDKEGTWWVFTYFACHYKGPKWYVDLMCVHKDLADRAECGNGIIEIGEDCDDGNRVNNDGCNDNCKHETLSGSANDNGFEVMALDEWSSSKYMIRSRPGVGAHERKEDLPSRAGRWPAGEPSRAAPDH